MKPEIFATIMDFFASGLPILTDAKPSSDTHVYYYNMFNKHHYGIIIIQFNLVCMSVPLLTPSLVMMSLRLSFITYSEIPRCTRI